jgi:hypothetical protein
MRLKIGKALEVNEVNEVNKDALSDMRKMMREINTITRVPVIIG